MHVPIQPLDARAMAAARERQARPGRLGRLEELAVWLAGITGEARVRARIVVAVADHGVTADGLSDAGAQELAGVVEGRGAVSGLARAVDADLIAVDAGVHASTTHLEVVHTGLRPSANPAVEPALTRDDARHAVKVGLKLAAAARNDGLALVAGGALGDTTPAVALACWLTGAAPEDLTDAPLVERALARHAARPGGATPAGESPPNALPAARGALAALASLGGGDVALLTGLALGAGRYGLGYVCDGVTATAAAAVATAIAPDLRPRLLAGHRSPDPAHARLLAHLGLNPVLDLQIGAGDGSGAAAALAILQLAATVNEGAVSPA